MTPRKRRRPSPVQPVNRVEVLRIYERESWVVRILSPRYGGLFVHFVGKHGVYCPGEGQCYPPHHKVKTDYRGYCAAEQYLQGQNKWLPVVLEIPCSLELKFRVDFGRGQVWRLWRDAKYRDQVEPLQSEQLEPIPPDLLPPEFNILPTLLTIYNVDEIILDKINPRPLPVVLPLSEGPPPKGLLSSSATPAPVPVRLAKPFSEMIRDKERQQANGHGERNGV